MQKITLYHNPQCSKSQKTLEILRNEGFNPIVIEYLKTPLNLDQLNELRAHFSLNDFIRSNEKQFTELGLSLDNEAQIIKAMVKAPLLMQRPIVTYNGKAIIGRPPEKVLELFA
ncbi:MAG: arsenate reductase (glutaredoxin) [bacterium]|nr:arsenate reductase (glutaredoxin) [bacterium]